MNKKLNASVNTSASDAPAKRGQRLNRSALKKTGADPTSGMPEAFTDLKTLAQPAGKNTGTTIPEIVSFSAFELSRLIQSRQISCREVMTGYLDHIADVNPRVNAIVALQDCDGLLEQADEKDARLSRGICDGWMHGLPHAVKDLALTKDILTTLGSPLFKDNVPQVDSIFVERIKRAGAIIIGKTNTPEFGLGSQTHNRVYGATLNPYDLTKTCGGSSGGAAASLALRMLPVADGSDFGGSLRNPAAYCNVLGLRPSAGRVPFGPTSEVFLSQLGYEGPMARTATDLALLLSVQAGYDKRAPLSMTDDPAQFIGSLASDRKGKRVAWLGDWDGYLPMEAGVLDVCGQGIKTLSDIGCRVEDFKIPFSPEKLWKTWLVHRHFLVGGALSALYSNPVKRAYLKQEAIWEVEGITKLNALDIFAASEERSAWYRTLLKVFEQFDYIAVPSAQLFPFDVETPWPQEIAGRKMDTYHRWMEVVCPWTISGCPVLNLPAGFNSDGLPMGIQVIGRPHADRSLLELACAYESEADWVGKYFPPIISI